MEQLLQLGQPKLTEVSRGKRQPYRQATHALISTRQNWHNWGKKKERERENVSAASSSSPIFHRSQKEINLPGFFLQVVPRPRSSKGLRENGGRQKMFPIATPEPSISLIRSCQASNPPDNLIPGQTGRTSRQTDSQLKQTFRQTDGHQKWGEQQTI